MTPTICNLRSCDVGKCDADADVTQLQALGGSVAELFAERRQQKRRPAFAAAAVKFRSLPLFATVILLTICIAGQAPLGSARTVTNQARPQPVQPVIGADNSNEKKSGTRQLSIPAFANAGTVKGLLVWRIEDFNPVLVPATEFGKFYTGDSYIVLNTKESKTKELSWDVHFWLGLETSQDEAGAAAIYTVHLDDQLHGKPVQHRETQEHESSLFMSYFKNGVRYAAGGVASGFSHTTTNAVGEKRLFQVKGKRDVRVREVALTISSMNQGDCFLLDSGAKIYVYVGPKAKRVEKLKAISVANQIRDQDHRGRATVEILDEFSTDADRAVFFSELGSGSAAEVPEDPQDDEEYERSDRATLYRVSDASGKPSVTQVATTPLSQAALKPEDCFILDAGTVIFVWVGKSATKDEREKAMQNAQDFITSKNYPRWTRVQRIVQNAETAPFKQYFTTWQDRGMAATRLIRAANGDYSSEAVFDPSVLHSLVRSGGKALNSMPDEGDEGLAEVFRLENFKLLPVALEQSDVLYSGDSYVVRYNYYNEGGEIGLVIYCWQGKNSSLEERAASAMLAAEMGRDLHAVQVRVVQGSEPRHFLKAFLGRLIVKIGEHATGLGNVVKGGSKEEEEREEKEEDEEEDEVGVAVAGLQLYRVRGTDDNDLHAEQLTARAQSLASDDSFVLITAAGTAFVWHGSGATQFERKAAKLVASRLGHAKAEVCLEGAEPEAFWTELGGHGDYEREVADAGLAPLLEPRLFHWSIRHNGQLNVEEVDQFAQEDLNVDDIMVLDAGDEVYIWIGAGATEEEVAKSDHMANMYIRFEPSVRTVDTVNFIRVPQGYEPRSFRRLFGAWDDEMWDQNQPSYEQLRNELLSYRTI